MFEITVHALLQCVEFECSASCLLCVGTLTKTWSNSGLPFASLTALDWTNGLQNRGIKKESERICDAP